MFPKPSVTEKYIICSFAFTHLKDTRSVSLSFSSSLLRCSINELGLMVTSSLTAQVLSERHNNHSVLHTFKCKILKCMRFYFLIFFLLAKISFFFGVNFRSRYECSMPENGTEDSSKQSNMKY